MTEEASGWKIETSALGVEGTVISVRSRVHFVSINLIFDNYSVIITG